MYETAPAARGCQRRAWGYQRGGGSTCRNLELRVPNDVAIMGMNNNLAVCELTRPSLTSVDLGYTRLRREAAALLDRLMNGGSKPRHPILVPHADVVRRKSIDMLAIAGRCGFTNMERFRVVFSKNTGIPASTYRKRLRVASEKQ